jgi:hypothetical protein
MIISRAGRPGSTLNRQRLRKWRNTMSQNSKVLHSALMSLALAATIPAAWAGDAPKFRVPVQDSSQPPRPVHVLDLKAPDIHDVMSADEIAAALPDSDEDYGGPETVQVRGVVPVPYVPGGFAALYWAVTHPIESWRILAPVQ